MTVHTVTPDIVNPRFMDEVVLKDVFPLKELSILMTILFNFNLHAVVINLIVAII